MPGVQLKDHQYDALLRMKNGCILCGGVGSGKSRTGLAYYYIVNGGEVNSPTYIPMKARPMDLFIITTAQKRDKCEWEGELSNFVMTTDKSISRYRHDIHIDSWNNITKYTEIKNAFFIFDEQRVIGSGSWVKSFLKITKNNQWILLSATPGDTWKDYIPVFIANGFYKNKTEFNRQHAIFSRFTKYPKIDRYINEGRLIRLRKDILVDMNFDRKTKPHHYYINTDFNKILYSKIANDRWNPYTNEPILNASEYCYILRKLVNSDPSRVLAVMEILQDHPKAIIFYSYDYELELLHKLFDKKYHNIIEKNEKHNEPIPEEAYNWICLIDEKYAMREWNGHKHEEIPEDDDFWVYLVQYLAGSEGWNCILTDTIIFYSQSYSYRTMHQAGGRIDRLDTPFIDLHYYHLKTISKIDSAIRDAYIKKKKFNEAAFAPIFKKEKQDV